MKVNTTGKYMAHLWRFLVYPLTEEIHQQTTYLIVDPLERRASTEDRLWVYIDEN